MLLSRNLLCVSLVLVSGMAVAVAAVKLFHAHQEYPVGVDPSGLAVADFDEDGALDLAVVDRYENLVWVLRGGGDGSFVLGTSVVPDQTLLLGDLTCAVSGDFNADGHADLVLALMQPSWSKEGPDFVQVFNGTGQMTFARGPDLTVGDHPTAMLADDLDDNGTLDLAVLDYVSGDVALLAGLGQTGFLPAVFLGVPGAGINLRAGDLNHDGRKDLVVGHLAPFSFLSILTGNANGTFAMQQLPLNVPEASSLTLADFDGDGLDDLAVGHQASDQLLVMRNMTDPSGALRFADTVTYNMRSPVDLVAADLNGDGLLDLTAAGLTRDIVPVLLGRGDGSFKRVRDYSVGNGPVDIEPTDLNGDGRLDLVTADLGGSISVLLNR